MAATAQAAPLIELRQLSFLVLLAEELHFGRAAARAYISRAAFSEQIIALERELGVTLFTRTSRPVRLTAAGEEALPRAQAILRSVGELRSATRSAASEERRELRIGLAAAAIDITAAVLRGYTHEHPEVDLFVRQYDFGDPAAGLRDGETDAALIWGPLDDTGLRVTELFRDELMVMLPAGHLLATASRLSAYDLVDETWCDAPATDAVWRRFWLLDDFRGGKAARLGAVARSPEGSVELVAAGRGIALIPASIGRRLQLEAVRFIGVQDAPPCLVAVATPADRTALADSFVAIAQAAARGRPADGPAVDPARE